MNVETRYFKTFGWDDLYVEYKEATGNFRNTAKVVERLAQTVDGMLSPQYEAEMRCMLVLRGRARRALAQMADRLERQQ
jgi:hypothetical protein